MTDNIREDGTISDEVKKQVENEMKSHFRPEFINRIDDIVVFSPLTEKEVGRIVELSMNDIRARLEDREISLGLTDAAKDLIIREAYSPVYGARPVKRYLQKNIETLVAEKIIRGEIVDGMAVYVDVDGEGRITVHE